jgi:hypothetical protein
MSGKRHFAVHSRLKELLGLWVVNADLEVKRCLSGASKNLLGLWLLDEHFEDPGPSGFELDDVVLLVVDNEEISEVEFSSCELTHELYPVEVVGKVNPTTFLIEDSRF